LKHKGVWARAVPRPPSSPRVREKDGCHRVELCEDRERRGPFRPALHVLAAPRWHAVLSDRASVRHRGTPPCRAGSSCGALFSPACSAQLRCHEPRGAKSCGSPMLRGERIAKPAEWGHPLGRSLSWTSPAGSNETSML